MIAYALIIGGAVLLAGLLFGGPILGGLGTAFTYATTRAPAATSTVNEDASDLEAFNRLKARMVRLKCPEGIAAIATVGQHFLHDAGAHA